MSTTFTSSNGGIASASVNGNEGVGNNGSARAISLEGKENVKVDDTKMSARMQKFMEQSAAAGERERIIPGKGTGDTKSQTKANIDGDKDELEVVM